MHYQSSLSDLVRYLFLVLVGLWFKIEVFSHNGKLLENHYHVFSKLPCPMLQGHSIKSILSWANFSADTGPSCELIKAVNASVHYAVIGLHHGLSPVRRRPIFWDNDGLLSIRSYGAYFDEILVKVSVQENAYANDFSQNGRHLVMRCFIYIYIYG